MNQSPSSVESEVVAAVRERIARFEQTAETLEVAIASARAQLEKAERQALALKADLATFKDLLTNF